MMDIVLTISGYILVAILFGFIFGWFMAKAILKENFEEQIEALSTNYDNNKNSIDVHCQEQDREISKLKDQIKQLKSQHEKEVDAFLEERIDITMKYKKLLDKCNATD
jgi:flagellar motility protein MotE (MotC chaperone)